MKKKKKGLPDSCGEWMNILKEKYDLASQVKRKAMGSWAGPYFVFAIKADGLSKEQAEEKRIELEKDLNIRYETVYSDKKTNAYELKGSYAFPLYMLILIFENGISEEEFESFRELGTDKNDATKIFVIDLVSKKCARGSGRKGFYIGFPNPKNVCPKLFG